jgi:hypothetical protein
MRALKLSVFDLSKSFAVGSTGFVNSSFKSYGLQSRPPITYARAGFELGPQERFYRKNARVLEESLQSVRPRHRTDVLAVDPIITATHLELSI